MSPGWRRCHVAGWRLVKAVIFVWFSEDVRLTRCWDGRAFGTGKVPSIVAKALAGS